MNLALLTGAFVLLTMPRTSSSARIVERALAFGATSAVAWEIAEYYAFLSRSSEREFAYADTLGDLALGVVGAVVAAVVVRRLWASGHLEQVEPVIRHSTREPTGAAQSRDGAPTRAAATSDDVAQDRAEALTRAHEHATTWLESLPTRPVPPRASVEEVVAALGTELPDGPRPAVETVELLAEACEPGLTAMGSGRFFGFVIGGTHPAALATDWLVSAWDQNAGLRLVTPGLLGGRGDRRRLAARPPRAPDRRGRRLRHRGDDVQLHLPGRGS